MSKRALMEIGSERERDFWAEEERKEFFSSIWKKEEKGREEFSDEQKKTKKMKKKNTNTSVLGEFLTRLNFKINERFVTKTF
jgi:hypothetical protein